MSTYHAPQIIDQRPVNGRLDDWVSIKPFSDAEIKHQVEPLDTYEAPSISEQRDLDGHLAGLRSIPL